MTSITIIVPTFGRSTLGRVLGQIKEQMQPQDQLIVAWDGPSSEETRSAIQELGVELVTLPERVGDFGCTPNDEATKHARGDFIWYLGDDDHYPPTSLDLIRLLCPADPNAVHVFSMMHTGRKLGTSIEACNVSSQQIVVPNRSDMPKWRDFPPGQELLSDWHWIDRCIRYVGRYVYHDEVIAILDHQNFGRML
jgi:glycosyltransferase involved in cell wall biosynthesis